MYTLYTLNCPAKKKKKQKQNLHSHSNMHFPLIYNYDSNIIYND